MQALGLSEQSMRDEVHRGHQTITAYSFIAYSPFCLQPEISKVVVDHSTETDAIKKIRLNILYHYTILNTIMII